MQWLLTVLWGHTLRLPVQTQNLEHSRPQVTEAVDNGGFSREGSLTQHTLWCHSRDVPCETEP